MAKNLMNEMEPKFSAFLSGGLPQISLQILTAAACLGLLTGCANRRVREAGPEVSAVEAPEESVQVTDHGKYSDEVALLEARFAEGAGEADVDVLAPKLYGAAVTAFNDAKALIELGGAESEITKGLAQSLTELRRAEQRAAVARTALRSVREARQAAIDQDAGLHLADELAVIDLRYLEAVGFIEGGDSDVSRKRKANLVQDYNRLADKAVRAAAGSAGLAGSGGEPGEVSAEGEAPAEVAN